MAEYKHMRTSLSGEANCSGDAWIAAVSDWVGHFIHVRPKFPTPIGTVEYAPGQKKGVYPCTRHLGVDEERLKMLPPEFAAVMPKMFSETLVMVDLEARMGLYRINDTPLGMKNYHAFMDVDLISDTKCKVTFTSRCDIPVEAPEEAFLPTFHEAYRVLIEGVAEYANILAKKAAE